MTEQYRIREEYEITDDTSRIRICGKCRGRFVSIHELLNSRDCGFCDIPYILLESDSLVKDSSMSIFHSIGGGDIE